MRIQEKPQKLFKIPVTLPIRIRQRPSSWSSTPDLDEAQKQKTLTSIGVSGSSNASAPNTPQPVKQSESNEISISVQLPVRRRHTATTYENVSMYHRQLKPHFIILKFLKNLIKYFSSHKSSKYNFLHCYETYT